MLCHPSIEISDKAVNHLYESAAKLYRLDPGNQEVPMADRNLCFNTFSFCDIPEYRFPGGVNRVDLGEESRNIVKLCSRILICKPHVRSEDISENNVSCHAETTKHNQSCNPSIRYVLGVEVAGIIAKGV